MTLRKCGKKPNLRTLLQPADLRRIPASQLLAERDYWEGIRRLGGLLQLQMAEVMVDHAIGSVSDYRNVGPRALHAEPERIEALGRYGLSGLALGQLIRRAYDGLAEDGQTRFYPGVLTIDSDLRTTHQGSVVHHGLHDNLETVLPNFNPDRPVQWYEDDMLVVRAARPAETSLTFIPRFEAMSEMQFDPTAYVTLKPMLKPAYIQQA